MNRPLPRAAAWIGVVIALALIVACLASLTGCNAAYGATGHGREHRYAARVFGNSPAQQRCLVQLWDRESGWDPYAVNPNSGAAGIPQALPAVHGHPYALGDWRAQIWWGHRYILRRYGDPCTALSHENAKGWY
jgi:hypothetical protein